MPIIGEHVEIERKPKLGGGGPGKIPHRRGYGGGDDGDNRRRGDSFSSHQRLRRGRVGVVICIAFVTALFAGLTVAYVARQHTGPYDPAHLQNVPNWKPLTLPYLQLWINSLLLVLSSITLELARNGMLKKVEFANMGIVPPRLKTDLPWLNITLALGFTFLAGQLLVWNTLRAHGAFHISNPSSTFFIAFTGLHAVHLAGGMIVLLYTSFGNWLHMKFESQRINVEVTSWYWHFMGVLWFGIFALLHFAKG
jgi:cytochrome c oxidase subunit 3